MGIDWTARSRRLEAFLEAHAHLWRPTPFHVPRPAWCEGHPELTAALLGLEAEQAAALAAEPGQLAAWLAAFLPTLEGLPELVALPKPTRPAAPLPEPLAWEVPGRKRAQIEAFAAAVGEPRAPVLEWCAGKGHLGRLVAQRWQAEVTSLDRDARLCQAGLTLARRAGVRQDFLCADALHPDSARQLPKRHALALHACGDLHRALIQGAVGHGASALDLAPCCYYRTESPEYRPLNPDARLRLSRDELHLPVTETVTAGARERRQRDRSMAWKLGFLALRQAITGDLQPYRLKPVPAAWQREGFAAWCQRLAAREGLALPGQIDWPHWEAIGWQRQREVLRLDLVRLAFRRALELWLVLDQALYLQGAGFAVHVSEFCARALTPRNLLISARRD